MKDKINYFKLIKISLFLSLNFLLTVIFFLLFNATKNLKYNDPQREWNTIIGLLLAIEFIGLSIYLGLRVIKRSQVLVLEG